MPSVNHHVVGQQYWRSLEQLSGSAEIQRAVEAEFPGYDPEEIKAMSRRRFLKFMGASLALAGLTLSGCRRWPKEKLAPYAAAARDRSPGVPEQYATVMNLGGVGFGLLVTSFDGRPIKIEGNPTHPYSLGATDAIAQASVLELYDPDRSAYPVDRSSSQAKPSTWESFFEFARNHFGKLKATNGAGFAVLSEADASPALADLKGRLAKAYPQVKWFEYEPLSRDNEIAGTRIAFGQAVRPILHLEKAAVIASFDADLLGSHPAHVLYARQWAQGRKTADSFAMSRLYVAESTYSVTGASADERLAVRASRVEEVLAQLAQALGLNATTRPSSVDEDAKFIESLAKDLKANPGRSVVAVGADQPASAHALAWAINEKIGAMGTTVTFVAEPDADRVSHADAIASLADDIKAGRVQTLLMIGGNPAYDAPADLEFAKLLGKVTGIHLSLYNNETSVLSTWHLPRAHYLEAWGAGRAWDGTLSVAQPLIEPLYGGKSAIELLAMISGDAVSDGDQLVRRSFAGVVRGDFEKGYRKVLHDGMLAGSAYATVKPVSAGLVRAARDAAPSPGFEVRFLADPKTYDGRFANNGWMQELPHPITKLTWDNAALIAKSDADKLGITTGDVITISSGGQSLQIAAYVLPGQPAGCIGLPLGYGRKAAGHVGNGVGFDTYSLRRSGSMSFAAAEIRTTSKKYELALTQDHHIIDELGMKIRAERVGEKNKSGKILHETTLAEHKAESSVAKKNSDGSVSLQLFDPPSKFNDPYAWGMAVDMNSCMGCNACVVACQAENNIPIVGKEEVKNNREMHWIRIDRYFKGDANDTSPELTFQPVMCVHCENAPCEQVCPVGATMHDSEGLNTMVYNRCIGTRYCSNNCPYKVRRFNYLDWHSKDPRGGRMPWLGIPDQQQLASIDKIKQMVFNPEVTVRMRGVMEKCTYCVQRIHAAKTDRRNRGEEVKDGDVVTACQQVCPTQAIVFGDLNDPNSRVSQLQKNNRAYGMLDEELNTRPRTQHLAKVRNPVED